MEIVINAFMIILIIIYLLSGFYGFIYWWTKDNDFTIIDIWFAVLLTLFGPLSFFIMWFIYNTFHIFDPKKKSAILIKKKEK